MKRKIQIFIALLTSIIFLTLIISLQFLSEKEQKELLELKIDQIEYITIYPYESFFDLKKNERDKVLYYFTKQEIIDFLFTMNDLKPYDVNHPKMKDGSFDLIIKKRGENKPVVIFIFFEDAMNSVIIELPNGHYSSKNYSFFKKMLEEAKKITP